MGSITTQGAVVIFFFLESNQRVTNSPIKLIIEEKFPPNVYFHVDCERPKFYFVLK